ncbi:DUF4112 domain-containing protein [Hydrocarboniclastica marina]|nr:DUF4112 domain-containing protein [Hydrocarboniclastica marina]
MDDPSPTHSTHVQSPKSMSEADRARHEALLTRIDRFSSAMDNRFRLPGTRLRFGFDGLVGLIPVAGDAITTVLSLYLIGEALKIGAPASVVRRMGVNVGLDFLVGLVPIAGDALDFAFKANTRNVALLRNYTQSQIKPDETGKGLSPWVWVLAGLGALSLIFIIAAL